MGTVYFTGVSTYSAELQNVISRSVAIASFPLTLMQNEQSRLQAEGSALSSLDSKFTAAQTALKNLESAIGPSSYTATSSDSSTATATAGEGALAATYTVEVLDAGSSTNTLSQSTLPTVTDPFSGSISSSGTFTLTVNGSAFTITPGGTGLMDLANAINDSGAGVQASLVNLGSSSAPDYRLSIRSTKLGADTIQLNDGTADLLDTLSTGNTASYKVNGINTVIQSDSQTVTLAPGVSVNLLKANPGNPATITVGQSSANLLTALNSFISAYNSAVDAVDGQHGESAGPLSGDSVLNSLTRALRQITQYSPGSGAISGLASIGITLDNSGKLSLDQTVFDSLSVQDVAQFLGSTDGGGFLKAANDAFNTVEDPDTGALKTAIASNTARQTDEADQIDTEQQRIDDFTANLVNQMASSDALIAQLESQKTYMTALFTAFIDSTNKSSNG